MCDAVYVNFPETAHKQAATKHVKYGTCERV